MYKGSSEVNKKVRAVSAKSSSHRQRPVSSTGSRNFQKTQTFQGIYNYPRQASPVKKSIPKGLGFQGINTEQLAKFKRASSFITTKDRQQLYDENIKLKKQLNKLHDDYIIIKGKFQATGKKTKQRNKQLEMQFEKPLYWGGSKTHLISGIKFQYSKLKQDYATLQNQNRQLKVQFLESRIPELNIYCENLQKQNQRLQYRLQQIMEANISVPSKTNKQIMGYMYTQSTEKIKKLSQKLTENEEKLQNVSAAITQKQKKLAFLQKLLIEKDNKGYHLYRKTQKLEKQLHNKDQKIQELHENIKNIAIQNQKYLKKIKIQNQKDKSEHQKTFLNEIYNKQKVIKSLEEDNQRMEGVINKLRTGTGNSANKIKMARKSSINYPLMYQSLNKIDQVNGQNQLTKSIKVNNYTSQLINYEETNNNKDIQSPKKKVRVRQTADKKHSEHAKKVRKIDHSQVEEIGQLIKCRMIVASTDDNGLKQLFNYKKMIKQKQNNDQKSDQKAQDLLKQYSQDKGSGNSTPRYNQQEQQQKQKWQKQYIPMWEAQKILQNNPFRLTTDQAFIVARYAIEDAQQQHVYCDQNNQNKRDVVKSIIRALVGSYELPTQQVYQKYEDFMEKYESNLQSALESYYPGGVVSSRKFLDIFKGLGYDYNSLIQEYLLAVISTSAKDLNQLYYRPLFQQRVQKQNNQEKI